MTDMDWAEIEARRLTAAWRPVADALRKAKADGFRMAVEIVKEKHNPDARSEIIDEGKDERYFYTHVKTISLWDILEEAASKLDPRDQYND